MGGNIPALIGKKIIKFQFALTQSFPNLPLGENKVTYRLKENYNYIIPISVNWKNKVNKNDYIGFDLETDNGKCFTVVYNTQTENMSYLVSYIYVKTE